MIAAHDAELPLVVKYFPEFPVWLGNASTVAQLAAEPSVVRYLPECVACDGTTYTLDVSSDIVTEPDVPPPLSPVPAVTAVMSPGLAGAHSSPVAVAELTLRTYPLVAATVSGLNASKPVPTSKSPLASNDAATAAAALAALAAAEVALVAALVADVAADDALVAAALADDAALVALVAAAVADDADAVALLAEAVADAAALVALVAAAVAELAAVVA